MGRKYTVPKAWLYGRQCSPRGDGCVVCRGQSVYESDSMNPMVVFWIVFGCVFGLGLLAMRLRTALPDHHLSDETKDTVKIAMGLLATISALVLGLMVASAKSSYDAQKNDVVAAAAKFVMLDRMLAHYGPETTAPRALLHRSAENMLKRLWPESASEPVQLDPSTSPGDALYAAVQSLTPQNEAERAFKPRR